MSEVKFSVEITIKESDEVEDGLEVSVMETSKWTSLGSLHTKDWKKCIALFADVIDAKRKAHAIQRAADEAEQAAREAIPNPANGAKDA